MRDTLRQQLQASLGTSYTLERELGGGGMSRVFVARDDALGRTVVVKVLAPELAEGLSAERFTREIRLAAALQEPHIVPVLTAGATAEGRLPWYTMPFVEGESLRARLQREPTVPRSEAVSILRDVAKALAYAHARGIVHRDIKPENVLLSSGTAVVTDFGIAKAVRAARTVAPGGTLTQVGTSLGTPAYMAPEQAAGDEVDHRADFYAWGIMAYELLAGRHPFADRTTAQQLLAAHLAELPPPLDRVAPSVPAPLAALVMRALNKDRASRPASAAELLAALDAAIATPQADRRGIPRWVAAAAGLVALLALGGGVLAWRARQTSPVTDERLVAVLPFRVAGADPSLAFLREGMVDLLAAKLTGATRVADARAVLAAWRAAGGTETVDVDAAASTRIAARLGARDVLLGAVTGDRATIVLRASLLPVSGGAAREATVQGPRDSVSALVDRLAGQLLMLRAGEDVTALGALAGTPLPAIRAFLDGQALARRGRYEQALDHFRDAVAADSNFAAAWYGVLDMASWVAIGSALDSASVALVRLRDRLTPATRALVEARIGLGYPVQPTNAETRRLAERATQVAPDNPAAWQYLGEALYHWAPAEGVPEAHARATAAFERALALDSSYTSAIEHLPDLYYERGDTAAMRRAIAARLARDSTSHTALAALYFADVVLRDAARGAQWRARTREDASSVGDVVLLAVELGLPLGALDSAQTAAAARGVTDAERREALFRVAEVALVRGQPARAARLLREALASLGTGVGAEQAVLDHLFADGDSALAADSRRRLDRKLAVSDSAAKYQSAWFAAALYDLMMGDPATARRAVAHLRAVPPARCGRRVPTLCADYARVLDAQLAAIERRPDAGARLAELDSMLRAGPVRNGPLLQVGNLIAAQLWERSGDLARALAATRRRTHFNGWEWSIGTSLREEGRLAAATGDRAGAVQAYRKYLVLREDAEPALRPHLESVRRELARLEREPAGH